MFKRAVAKFSNPQMARYTGSELQFTALGIPLWFFQQDGLARRIRRQQCRKMPTVMLLEEQIASCQRLAVTAGWPPAQQPTPHRLLPVLRHVAQLHVWAHPQGLNGVLDQC